MSGVKGRSGRKGSKAKQVSKALNQIDMAMPSLIWKLIERAQNGDREALIYLIDRRLGKPTQAIDVEGGEKLGTGLVVELFKLLAEKKRELDTKVLSIEGGKDGEQTEGASEGAEAETA
mgnify:CR=1 FL=1|jgi:hypothetical protein|tara:strand:- start:34487 stop:34843 length:357 start_codon:yes stop_codon:yes gene_type:complete